DEALTEIRRVCTRRDLEFVCVPDVFGLSLAHQANSAQTDGAATPIGDAGLALALPRYFRCKRAIDFCAALMLAVALLPLWTVVAALTFLDLGSPILFWQQRTGLNGRQFLMYKFRTLQPSFDWHGQKTAEGQRLSWIGRAGLAFDLRIAAITALSLIRGDRRSAQALAQARGLRGAPVEWPSTSLREPPLAEEGQPPSVLSA